MFVLPFSFWFSLFSYKKKENGKLGRERKYSILGVKSKDFEDFKKVALLMKPWVHLTKEGLKEIRKIKSRMNSGREY